MLVTQKNVKSSTLVVKSGVNNIKGCNDCLPVSNFEFVLQENNKIHSNFIMPITAQSTYKSIKSKLLFVLLQLQGEGYIPTFFKCSIIKKRENPLRTHA